MRIIDRYIGREVLSHALLGLLVFTFVFFVPQLVRLMELVVRHSAGLGAVALLFACTLPGVLTFTMPMAVLVGVLIGLGRMSADSEVIALQTVGLSLRRLLVPIGAFALGTVVITLAMTSWFGPLALHTFRDLEEQLRATQASFQVQPRVFDERFPRLVLYVQDVEAAGTRWHGIFLAETATENAPRLTLAEDAIVLADRAQGKLQFHLRNGSTHDYSRREPDRYSLTTFGQSDLPVTVVDIGAHRPGHPTVGERPLGQLLAAEGPQFLESRVEFHRRLAFPAACLVFALLGIPLGARPRRGGRAAGFIVALLLILGYYVIFVSGVGLARRGLIPAGLGIWGANLVATLVALALLPRIEQVRGEGLLDRWAHAYSEWRHKRKPAAEGPQEPAPVPAAPVAPLAAVPSRNGNPVGFLTLVDLYLLRQFVAYFVTMLVAFILLYEVFTFFELLEDIGKHNIPFLVVEEYFRYLVPYVTYLFAPLAALVAVLVTLGIMSKHNEIVALKAAGVSLYRLAAPLLGAGLLLAFGLIALDSTYLPYTNQKQDALRNQIKGRPAQTFYQPRRQWIFGEGVRVYNYDLFDPDRNLFGGLSVFELEPQSFQLRRRIFAARALWDESAGHWRLEDGWVRDFRGSAVTAFAPFTATVLPEITERPEYFKREVRQYHQMNWRELRTYIRELQQAGFDVARLSVQWHRKFAFPLILPIIMLLGIPFAFLVGTRGAISGLALAVAIGIVYWAASALFEALGAVGQLPPFLAGWAPSAIFGLLGLYFFFKMPT
jgi:LPS export ABC transporter permease LptF/LPS export ABC transporter permease LptG